MNGVHCYVCLTSRCLKAYSISTCFYPQSCIHMSMTKASGFTASRLSICLSIVVVVVVVVEAAAAAVATAAAIVLNVLRGTCMVRDT